MAFVWASSRHQREAVELLHVQLHGYLGRVRSPRTSVFRAARFVAPGHQGAVACRIQSADRAGPVSWCSNRRDSNRKEGKAGIRASLIGFGTCACACQLCRHDRADRFLQSGASLMRIPKSTGNASVGTGPVLSQCKQRMANTRSTSLFVSASANGHGGSADRRGRMIGQTGPARA